MNLKIEMNQNFVDDSNSYLLCRWGICNIKEMNVRLFPTLDDYTHNIGIVIDPDDFFHNYWKYRNGTHVKNGHNMLFSKDYVFSFEHDGYAYELYRIDKNSKYALLTFNIEMNLIGSVKGFEKHENAVDRIKTEYIETFGEDVFASSYHNPHQELIQYNNIIFAMIFKIAS
jgi:hypothetical protein